MVAVGGDWVDDTDDGGGCDDGDPDGADDAAADDTNGACRDAAALAVLDWPPMRAPHIRPKSGGQGLGVKT